MADSRIDQDQKDYDKIRSKYVGLKSSCENYVETISTNVDVSDLVNIHRNVVSQIDSIKALVTPTVESYASSLRAIEGVALFDLGDEVDDLEVLVDAFITQLVATMPKSADNSINERMITGKVQTKTFVSNGALALLRENLNDLVAGITVG